MDLLSIKVLLRECTKYCDLWTPHALYGWYIDPVIEHYRLHQTWIPAINLFYIGKIVSWFPPKLIIPTATATDIIISTAKYLLSALKKINKTSLLPPSDTITRKSPFQLNSIFYNAYSALKSQQYPFLNFQGFPLQNPLLQL